MNSSHTIRKAVYSASLDPVTNGHMHIIELAASLFDELVIIVGINPQKKYAFTLKERMDMVRDSTARIKNVTVTSCTGRYIVKCAEELGAQVIVRGLRNSTDLEYESTLAESNRRICPDVVTIMFTCPSHLAHISSSMVKGHVGADPDWETHVAYSVPTPVTHKLKENYILEKARSHWNTIMRDLDSPSKSESVFQNMVVTYREQQRVYHTLEHIVSVLDELDDVRDELANPAATKMAAFGHDRVYCTNERNGEQIASDEEESANATEDDLLKLGLPQQFIVDVKRMILSTNHTSAILDPDTQHLLDADLAIFGKSPEMFDRFEKGIRSEFAWVQEKEYRRVRTSVLRAFLERETIYHTRYFQKKYENMARDNLERLMKTLKE